MKYKAVGKTIGKMLLDCIIGLVYIIITFFIVLGLILLVNYFPILQTVLVGIMLLAFSIIIIFLIWSRFDELYNKYKGDNTYGCWRRNRQRVR